MVNRLVPGSIYVLPIDNQHFCDKNIYNSRLYYKNKHITIVNDNSSIISKWCSKLLCHLLMLPVIIYDCKMFLIHATVV